MKALKQTYFYIFNIPEGCTLDYTTFRKNNFLKDS